MRLEKTCLTCGTTATAKWYTGPTCASCYVTNWRLKNHEKFKTQHTRSSPETLLKRKLYRKTHKKHPESQRNNYLKYAYGINLAVYNEMVSSQGGFCKICGSAEPGRKGSTRLVVDHCHKTGKVRGLLCHLCNAGIGLLRDEITILEKALLYLRGAA